MGIASMQLSLAQPVGTISSTQKHKLGMLYVDEYGNKWRYAKNGATALAAGKLTGAAVAGIVALHTDLSVVAAAIGDRSVTVTLGATAATANQYKDGLLVAHDGTGKGYSYVIDSHPAADASATLTVKLVEPIKVALVAGATSEVNLVPNLYSGITITDAINCVPLGVPNVAVTAAYYCWIQSGGLAAVLTGDTSAIGVMAVAHTTDGAVGTLAASVDIDTPIVGVFVTTGVAGEYGPIRLTMD